MANNSLDLTKLLPKQYRDKTIDSLLKNLFARHVSKSDTVPLYGVVGDGETDVGEIKITEKTLERQINQITSLVYAEHATEKKIFSWPDLVQKLVLLGVDYSRIGDWFRTGSYNFMPPVDIDKFCNFHEYFWIGPWLKKSPNLPYYVLGIPNLIHLTDAFDRTNPDYYPEYYTIKRSGLDVAYDPISPIPNLPAGTWSDWGLTNLWVHKQDLIPFVNAHSNSIGFSDLVQATRPIIEYYDTLRINTAQNAQGEPVESVNNNKIVQKTRANQPPLFDIYNRYGEHYGKATAIFYYVEGSQYPVDSVIQRRIATDSNNDFIFEHSLVDSDTSELIFFKVWDGLSYELRTIWTPGGEAAPRYVKYDTSGTLINQDKFTNFRNYYWAALPGDCEPYNPTAEPQYAVIEGGVGISDWSVYNKWVHVSQLKLSQIPLYVQADRPIIEFNKYMETELLSGKWHTGQLPRFKIYAYDRVATGYSLLGHSSDPDLANLNDAYLNGAVLARIDDLGASLKAAVTSNPDLTSKTFEYAGETYFQGLDAVMFVPSMNGNVYGYRADVITSLGAGKGAVSNMSLDPEVVPEVVTLTYDVATNLFNVTGSVSGQNSDLIPSSPYTSTTGLNFTVTVGTSPFEHGDQITINVTGYVSVTEKAYVRVGAEYRTVDAPGKFVGEAVETIKTDGDPGSLNGVWEVPPQIEWNAHNETRSRVSQGDLYFHLTSVIGGQQDLDGSPTGNNNFRNLENPDLGAGGIIKQYDGNTQLLVSLLIQEGITVASVLEFARQSYENLFGSVHRFIEEVVPTMLTAAEFVPPQDGDVSIDPAVVTRFKEYFLSSSISKFPDFTSGTMQSVFADSTSSIPGVVVTLPYLGLCGLELPRKELDLEMNIPVLVHHDGHRSRLPPADVDLMKTVVKKKFVRSMGQESSGLVTAVEFPRDPFKGQFWFQTSTGKLFFYNVVSETGELPFDAEPGSYSLDRASGMIWQYSDEWVMLGVNETTLPWTEVRLDLIEQNIILAIESELYEKCPPLTRRLDDTSLQTDDAFIPSMKREFERFGAVYGTPDVYGSAYDSANAFTWNYRDLTGKEESWPEVYRAAYGTPRPDLQPWIPAGYTSESALMNDLAAGGLVQGSAQTWTPVLWTVQAVSDLIRQKYSDNGVSAKLSVDTTTGALLPPYSVYADGLFGSVPATASDAFSFGGMGPIETYWKKTLNYLYSLQKTYFKIDPLSYVEKTWGIKYDTVGGYYLNSSLGRKEAPTDFQLHGDQVTALTAAESALQRQKVNSMVSATVLAYPQNVQQYSVKCVNRKDGVFSVERNGSLIGFMTPGNAFSDDWTVLYISPKLTSFYWGDAFSVKVDVEGPPTISSSSEKYLHVEGLNQLYVQYRRVYGEDISLSINQTLLKGWQVRAGYRFGGLVNTDSLVVKNQNEVLDPSTYQVLIKENKFRTSSWLHALKIQLVQKGSSVGGAPRVGPGGTPGEDWVFRVDNFNDLKTDITWYTLNGDGPYTDFTVLDGKRTAFPWRHYSEPLSTQTHPVPFLVRGIQSVVNFLFGYAARLDADGWKFNDQENPVLDATTGRPLGFQLIVEQFINQQYLGVDAGSTFVVNPFYRKVWFSTPHGVVSDLYSPIGLEYETVCSVLDQTQRPLSKGDLRVFRQDDVTEFVFDKPVYTAHVLVSEYEHVVLFNDYTVADILMYDAFLGQRADKVFLSGEKQREFTGRLDLGGHYVSGDQMRRNIENSVSGILKMYDTTGNPSQGPDTERARSILGFQKKGYFEARGNTDATEFRFWQGMIANKGTNFAVDAYVNSSQYQSAKLDEYWAYKIAEYGDAREVRKVEMKVEPDDCASQITKYLLLEDDELGLIKEYKKNGGFDVSNLGVTAYDVATLYTAIQSPGFDYVDPAGCVIIRPDDESRWFRYDDLRSMEYFEAAPIAEYMLFATRTDAAYIIYGSDGERVRADCFEIVDMSDPELTVYREMGAISDSDPFDMVSYDENPYDRKIQVSNFPDYDDPLFRRLNHHTIQITDPILLNKPLKVVAYGPAFARFSPSSLIDYRNNVSAKSDVVWWDPARGVHHPQAFNEVDYVRDKDPAKYNQSLVVFKNSSVDVMKPWGDEHVGRVWWNTEGLEYQPYSDAKIITDMDDRVSRWGAVSDASSIEVYEWVRSESHPSDYDVDPASDGNVAIRDVVKRERTWYQRPVAWKFSPNPLRTARAFSAYQPSRLRVEISSGVNGRAILNAGDFITVLDRGCKFSGAVYASQEKTDVQLRTIFGMAKIVSDPYVVIGNKSSYAGGPLFSDNPYFTVTAELDQRVLSFRKKNYLGEYRVAGEEDGNDFYLRMTHVASGETQRLRVHDLPVSSGIQDTYNFDAFGIVLVCTSNIGREDLVGMNESTRQKHAVLSIEMPHEIFLRSAVDVEIMVPFDADGTQAFFLDGSQDISRMGWVGWKDPSTNPNTGLQPPLNRYEPFVGDWTAIQGHLADVADDIRVRIADPWTWFDGRDFNPYKSVWTHWRKIESTVTVNDYFPVEETHETYVMSRFTFEGVRTDELESRGSVYVNEVELLPAQWSASLRMNGPFVVGAYPSIPALNPGDRLKVVLRPAPVSEADLKFDPEVADDIFTLVQYKIDYPHVLEEKRGQSDRKTHKYYYFWVKNKLSPSKIKKISVTNVANLLHHHDSVYGVPQIFKQSNQVDGRPNRYGLIAVNGLSQYVTESSMYKVRFTDNGTLRNTDEDMSLKNKHVEWVLLRPGQTTKIPRALWDKLTDTLVGKTADGRTLLPFTPLLKYDDRNGTSYRYGFGDGQVMEDILAAIATVKNTILNTRVDKYDGSMLVPDTISYDGFDITKLDSYFFDQSGSVDESKIRQFMSDLWRFAKPKQINEIFFAVMEDTASRNLETSDFFKTSFISISEIRTIN